MALINGLIYEQNGDVGHCTTTKPKIQRASAAVCSVEVPPNQKQLCCRWTTETIFGEKILHVYFNQYVDDNNVSTAS